MKKLVLSFLFSLALYAQTFPPPTPSGGVTGTITASPQFQIPYFTNAGTANTVGGTNLIQTNGTVFTMGVLAPGSVDYQTTTFQLSDLNSASPPACAPSCTTGNNTSTTFLVTVGGVNDSVMPNLFPQRIGIQSMLKNTGHNGVGKALVGTAITDVGNAIGLQTNAVTTANAAGQIAIGTDDTVTDNFEAGGTITANSINLQNAIAHEGDCRITNATTTNSFCSYINNQSSIFQPSGFYAEFIGMSNGSIASGSFVPNAVPWTRGIVISSGAVSGIGIDIGSTAQSSTGTLSTDTGGKNVTSVTGSDFSMLWGFANGVSTIRESGAGNIDQIYISGGSNCTAGQYTWNNTATSTTGALATAINTDGVNPCTGATWSMVGPSGTVRFTAMNNGGITCPGGCQGTMVLGSTGVFVANMPNEFIFQLGGQGNGTNSITITNGTGSLVNLTSGSSTLAGQFTANDGLGHASGWASNTNSIANSSIQGLPNIPTGMNNDLVYCVVPSAGICQLADAGYQFSNVALLNAVQTFTSAHTFNAGLVKSQGTGVSGSAFITVQAFGGSPTFLGQGALNVGGTPQASNVGTGITSLLAEGYNGTAYAVGGSISFNPVELWTSTANGTQIVFQVTNAGAHSQTTAMQIGADTGVTIGNPTGGDKGAGTLNVSGNLYVNGVAFAASSLTVGTTTVTGGSTTNILYDNAGVVGEYTPTTATAFLNIFTSSLKGLVPSSGGGTANFLRADGTWAAPSTSPGLVVGSTTITSGTSGNIEFNNGGVLGEYGLGFGLMTAGGNIAVNSTTVTATQYNQSGVQNYCHSTTGNTSYVCSFSTTGSTALASYSTGMRIWLQADTSTTTSATIAIDGLLTKTIDQADCSTAIGTQITANLMYELWYNGTVFCRVN